MGQSKSFTVVDPFETSVVRIEDVGVLAKLTIIGPSLVGFTKVDHGQTRASSARSPIPVFTFGTSISGSMILGTIVNQSSSDASISIQFVQIITFVASGQIRVDPAVLDSIVRVRLALAVVRHEVAGVTLHTGVRSFVDLAVGHVQREAVVVQRARHLGLVGDTKGEALGLAHGGRSPHVEVEILGKSVFALVAPQRVVHAASNGLREAQALVRVPVQVFVGHTLRANAFIRVIEAVLDFGLRLDALAVGHVVPGDAGQAGGDARVPVAVLDHFRDIHTDAFALDDVEDIVGLAQETGGREMVQ